MIKFSESTVQSSAADNLLEALLRDLDPGPYSPEELRRIVDEGCSIAIAVLKTLDKPMAEGLANFRPEDQNLVEMVAITMMVITLKAALDKIMLDSFMKLMGINPQE